MRLLVFAFLVVFAMGFATALFFNGLGTGAGLAAAALSIALILVMSVIGAAIAAPVPPRSTYLMDRPHWSVRGGTQYPDGFADFFRALAEIAPPDSFLALTDGAWDEEVRAAISKAASKIGDSLRVLPPLPQEFDRAVLSPDGRGIVPINGSQMAVFAGLAENHAPIEIAWHLAAFTRDGSWLEWFDATDDPISISLSIPEDAVAKFSDRIRGNLRLFLHLNLLPRGDWPESVDGLPASPTPYLTPSPAHVRPTNPFYPLPNPL